MFAITTRPQRESLLKFYSRGPYYTTEGGKLTTHDMCGEVSNYGPLTYREIRKRLQPTFGCDGCVMFEFAGMWIGIEQDGYMHS